MPVAADCHNRHISCRTVNNSLSSFRSAQSLHLSSTLHYNASCGTMKTRFSRLMFQGDGAVVKNEQLQDSREGRATIFLALLAIVAVGYLQLLHEVRAQSDKACRCSAGLLHDLRNRLEAYNVAHRAVRVPPGRARKAP